MCFLLCKKDLPIVNNNRFFLLKVNVSLMFGIPSVAAIPADERKYTIYIASSSDNYIPLTGSLTLEQVNDKYWRVNKPLEMFYAFHKKTDSPKKNTEK